MAPDDDKSARQQASDEFASKGALQSLWDNFVGQQKGLKGFKRYLYLAMIFLGFVLVWRSAFELVDAIPILDNPVVSLLLGVLILRYTGNVFTKLF